MVNPVRLTTLGEFGSPQFVADKLIQAEKRKVIASLDCGIYAGMIFISMLLMEYGGVGFSVNLYERQMKLISKITQFCVNFVRA